MGPFPHEGTTSGDMGLRALRGLTSSSRDLKAANRATAQLSELSLWMVKYVMCPIFLQLSLKQGLSQTPSCNGASAWLAR